MENVHTASKLLGIECDSVKNREFGQYLHVAGILICIPTLQRTWLQLYWQCNRMDKMYVYHQNTQKEGI